MKKIKWIFIIVLVFVIVVTSLFFILKNGNETNWESNGDDLNIGETDENAVQPSEALISLHKVFSLKNSDDVSKYGKDNGYDYEVDVDRHNLFDVDLFGYKFQVFYMFGENDYVLERKAALPLNVEKFNEDKYPIYKTLDAETIKNLCNDYLKSFCEVFNIEFNGQYYIIGNDGLVCDISQDESFSKVVSEQAIIEFTLREDTSVWRNVFSCVDGALICEIELYSEEDFGSEMITNMSCD